ncbi:MAG: hypothetical protein JSW71_07735 [Gemmatimonadota bacterium]|nr:MAG: hypothetical protein JSW71_07735 [Gemmatimonadota bacterium]
MCGSHAATVLCILLIPVPCLAQQPDTIRQPRVALTAGLGVSYAGLGAVGELYLGQPRYSVLVGVGGLPETDATAGFVGASLGLRGYSGGSESRLYLEVTGAYLVEEGDGDIYGPAVLAGYAHVAPNGRTFNVGVGAGRATDESVQPAFNIGFGYTWGRYRPR